MIKNYNLKLLNALYSWFWYNGLLEQENDEWVDFKNSHGTVCSRPKFTDNCIINILIKALRETPNDFLTLDYISNNYLVDMYYNEELNILWLLLVEMFGSCGTSPRSGWIEKKEECAEFLETIVRIDELSN